MSTMYAASSFVLVALTLYAAVSGSASTDRPAQPNHRRMLQDSNLAAHASNFHIPVAAHVPATGSGSFPASSHGKNDPAQIAPAPASSHGKNDPAQIAPAPASSHGKNDPAQIAPAPAAHAPHTLSKSHGVTRSLKWLYMIVLPAVGLLVLTGIACFLLPCRKTAVATIGPWKTGLSGQLQKAFVTGVPKLQRSELERACEDFSNIIASYPHYTVYKGTLSSGVEIAVVSTMVTSSKEWSEHSETCFRKKIDSLSRINHKNFINLLGFCEDEEPFARMMVLEYAPNGTLYENLHAEDFEHIDWRGRMRIIMGLAYCIQHLHELNPPVVHPDLHSSSILLTEDGAAKIADMSVWREVISEGKQPKNVVKSHEQVSAGLAENVYSFGVLLLEIISGKLPYSEHERSLANSALECVNSDGRISSSLLDPRLNAHKEGDLDTICEVIQSCIQSDPRNRPSMREITARLREAIAISPVAATPRISPLWWAELEVISAVEAG